MTSRRFGKYLLIERLGFGGMAEVWRAQNLGPEGFTRTLVIKRILPHRASDPMFVRMFVKEARLLARLAHTNIVQVFDFGEVDGEYFLAMELLRGHDLNAILREQSKRQLVPPAGLGAYTVLQLCRALAHVHSFALDGVPLDIVHRDVTPANVMLCRDGAVKLLDFGIAKALSASEETVTVAGGLKGKLSYMSPEQIEGRALDPRTDLFSAGIVLYELLTARRLFRGENDADTMARVRAADVAAPSLVNAAVPPELDAICARALARNRDSRYGSAAQMALALAEVVHALRWGSDDAAAYLHDLLPPPDVTAESPSVPTESLALPATAPLTALSPRRRAPSSSLVAALVVGLTATAGVVWRTGRPAALADAAPPSPAASALTTPTSMPPISTATTTTATTTPPTSNAMPSTATTPNATTSNAKTALAPTTATTASRSHAVSAAPHPHHHSTPSKPDSARPNEPVARAHRWSDDMLFNPADHHAK